MKGLRAAARLKYRQTVWDRLTKKQLLLMVCRYHSALISAASCLRVIRCSDEHSPYWEAPGGVGGQALAKADFLETLATGKSDDGQEKIYRSFFRSADELLFPADIQIRRIHWWVCTNCGTMIGKNSVGDLPKRRACQCTTGEFRPLQLSDIRPDLAEVSEDVVPKAGAQ